MLENTDEHKLSVWVVVVTYNNKEYIRPCLKSLVASDYPVSTVVVDNNSSDNTCEIIEQEFPQINLTKSERNLGFGLANNLGIRKAMEANADFVFLLNQDAWVNQNTITKLIDTALEFPTYGVIAPMQMNEDWNTVEPQFESYLHPDNTPDILVQMSTEHAKGVYQTAFVNAAGWLVSKKCLKQVGGFDPVFFMYGEDDDYVNRMNYHNIDLGICPKAKIVHVRNNLSPLTRKSESHQELKEQRIKRLLIQANISVKNINKDYNHALSKWKKDFKRKILRSLLLLLWTDYRLYKSVYTAFLANISTIKKHREICKKNQPSFLVPSNE